jgi:hypothetical protein
MREKCVNIKVKKMIGYIESLNKMLSTMDQCFERPEKYILEVLRPETNSENIICQTAQLSGNSTSCSGPLSRVTGRWASESCSQTNRPSLASWAGCL